MNNMMENDNMLEVWDEKTMPLVEVRDLKQHFNINMGLFKTKPLKAVDGVSFSIKKGETLGLVGESGCGKTTTGRSIIRLYDITGGSVYYKGERICAGTRTYKDAINAARKDYAAKKISKEEYVDVNSW